MQCCYIERQLDARAGLEVSAHTQDCADCRTLLRALGGIAVADAEPCWIEE